MVSFSVLSIHVYVYDKRMVVFKKVCCVKLTLRTALLEIYYKKPKYYFE